MLEKIESGADIVIGKRLKKNTSILRNAFSAINHKIFASWLHGFDLDVQSGMKLFKAEILTRVKVKPTQWTFDLEFLVKARNAGFKIEEVNIDFEDRKNGKSKINLVKSSVEIAMTAIKLKAKDNGIVEFSDEQNNTKGKGFHYKGKEFVPHNNLHHSSTALYRITRSQIFVIFSLITLLAISFVINWHKSIIIFVALLTVLYFFDLIFNLVLILKSFSKEIETNVNSDTIAERGNREWPMYSIFCPLYKEWEVLPQFVTAMNNLDYPKDRLQIMLLLEQDDQATIDKAESFGLPANFEIVVVPHSLPKTKPKACNYGLLKARGEYVVIYDAEDVPDEDQLKKAVIAFENADDRIVCMQAKLNFYNPHQNILTRAFTAEYSLWFDLVLTGLQSIYAPIPLGGTSNHFKLKDIKALGGWDAFNVTEDCDLGIRLAKLGFRTAIIQSQTLEEANSQYGNWFKQRTRWIKGYIQTYLVHMRHPRELFRSIKEPHIITFQLVVGGKVLSMFINPIMWIITLSYFIFRPIVGPFIESIYPTPILYMAVTSLIVGNFLYVYYYMIGCAKREQYDIIKYIFLIPVYWLAMSAAAWKALVELITNPHYWAKTKHGLHLNSNKGNKQAIKVIGRELVDANLIK